MLNNLEAVRDKRWKLHFRKGKEQIQELYDLVADPGETRNLYASNPDVVKALSEAADACRIDIGDDSTGVIGRNIRLIGRVEHADTLTHYDPDHPYLVAMYDLKDRG